MNNNKIFDRDKLFQLPGGKTISGAARHLMRFLEREEKMNAQMLRLENGSYVVQGRSCGAGKDKVLSVKFIPVGVSSMAVEIGRGRWIDKAAGCGTACIIAYPVFITLLCSLYKQCTLHRRVRNNIESFLIA